MAISLDKELEDTLKSNINSAVDKIVKIHENQQPKPILNRKGIAEYLNVAESTVSYWVSLGMPYVDIEGRKLYRPKSVNKWIESHEKSVKKQPVLGTTDIRKY